MSVELWFSQPPRSPSRTLTSAVDDRLKIGGSMSQSVVVLEKDPGVAKSLAGGLRPHFLVHVTRSREELRDNVARTHPEAVVLNIEHWLLDEVESLHRDFPALPIVCTHRIPDEEMWTAALSAGASDVCPTDDVGNVLTSVLRSMALSRHAAA
jgi:chemotaxis response regulator CheB